jgi:cytochrome b561
VLFTHGFGLFLGVVLILRGSMRTEYRQRRFQVKRRSAAEWASRIVYLLLGLFFITIEAVYFWSGVDWLQRVTRH